MELKERTIQMPFISLVKASVEGHLAKADQREFSPFFDPRSFLLFCRNPTLATSSQNKFTPEAFLDHLAVGVAKYRSLDDGLTYLLKETAWLHEIRHFHDCVCSITGYGQFLREWHVLHRLCVELDNFRRAGIFLEVPLHWAYVSDFVDISPRLKEFYYEAYNRHSNLMLYSTIMNGDIPVCGAPADLCDEEIIWCEYSDSPEKELRIPFYPGGAIADNRKECVLIALGFRALAEASAVILQQQIIRSLGQPFADEYYRRLRRAPEYIVLNFLLTKIHGRCMAGRGVRDDGWDLERELFRIIHATLSHRTGHDLRRTPGNVLVDLLKQRVNSVECKFEFSAQDTMQNMQEAMVIYSEDMAGNQQHDGLLENILKFALEKCLIPTIDVFKKQEHVELFPLDTPQWYEFFQLELPQPPLSVQGNYIGHSPYISDDEAMKLLYLIIGWICIQSATKQVLTEYELSCPIKSGEYRWLFGVQLARDVAGCDDASRGKPCVVKLGSRMGEAKRCMWKECLVALAFAGE